MKAFILNEKGEIDFVRLVFALLFMAVITYYSANNWFLNDWKGNLLSYVEKTNRECPMVNKDMITLDSVAFDGKKRLTHFVSLPLNNLSDEDMRDIKSKMVFETEKNIRSNKSLNDLISKDQIIFEQKVFDSDQNLIFEFSIKH